MYPSLYLRVVQHRGLRVLKIGAPNLGSISTLTDKSQSDYRLEVGKL